MKPIRVALSGSGFRLGAHLGALQAITEAGYEIIELAGTSGGSIVAALYASGMYLEDLYQMCMRMDWSPMMRFSPWALLRYRSLCSGTPMQRFLMDATHQKRFCDLAIDLKVVSADLLTEGEFVFSRETSPTVPIGLAARASASIPFIFPNVECAGAQLVDGGTCDNVPAGRLVADQVPRIGIYLRSDDTPLPKPPPGHRYRMRDLAPRLIDMMLAANEAAHVNLDRNTGATIVQVPTGYASSFDRNMAYATRQRLYHDGYNFTTEALKRLASRT